MSELKPCPFCGGSVTLTVMIGDWYEDGKDTGLSSYGWSIRHSKHNRECSSTRGFSSEAFLDAACCESEEAKQKLIAAWNRRDEEACRAELVNRYIELPLDADGVPIHIGDALSSDEYRGRQFPCRGMSVGVRNGKYWTVCMDYDSYSGTSEWCAASRCHHVR